MEEGRVAKYLSSEGRTRAGGGVFIFKNKKGVKKKVALTKRMKRTKTRRQEVEGREDGLLWKGLRRILLK